MSHLPVMGGQSGVNVPTIGVDLVALSESLAVGVTPTEGM
jgi:hypothetical protein